MHNIVEMDEKVDFNKVTNQSSTQGSSSILPNNQTDTGIDQNHCNKNQTGTRVVYGADVVKIDEKDVVTELIYSNAKEIVDQNRFIFEIRWKKAISVEEMRKELEDGKLPLETNMIDNPTDALNYAIDFVSRVEKGLSNFTSMDFFKLLDRNKPLYQAYLNLLSRNGYRICWLTHIESNKDADLVIKFLNMGIKIRHTRQLTQIKLAVSEKQFVGTIKKVTEGKMFEKILRSTDPMYMNHFQSLFEEL